MIKRSETDRQLLREQGHSYQRLALDCLLVSERKFAEFAPLIDDLLVKPRCPVRATAFEPDSKCPESSICLRTRGSQSSSSMTDRFFG